MITVEPCNGEHECVGWMGGDRSSPRWADYVARYVEPWQWKLTQAREWLLKQDPIPCADEFCNDYHLRFDDGTTWSPSWRAWGDFVQAAVDKSEGYMTYYMRGWGNPDERAWSP